MSSYGLEILGREECEALLRSQPVGRVGVCGAQPGVFPVLYTLLDGDVVFRTAPGEKLIAAALNRDVVFEIDAYDVATRSGWSVNVVGPVEEIEEPAERARAEALGLEPWAGEVPRPLRPGTYPCVDRTSDLQGNRRRVAMTQPEASPISQPLTHCPRCGSTRLQPVVESVAQEVHFLCQACARCWDVSLGSVQRAPAGDLLRLPGAGRCEYAYVLDHPETRDHPVAS